MDTRIIKIRQDVEELSAEEEASLREAGAVLRDGGLVAFPTETVYGLGGDALNPESSCKIYAAKGRPSDNPLIIHISRLEDLYSIVKSVPEEAMQLAEAFWPGPLTMIFEKADNVPYETTGGLETVAVRMPSNAVARKLISYAGGYVAAPSANTSGKPSPTVARYVIEDMSGKIDIIVDGGAGEIGLESTIVDLTVSPPQILRPGYITGEMLEMTLHSAVESDVTILRNDSAQAPKAPGMKYRHYAPRGEMVIVEGTPEEAVSYINKQAAADKEAGERVGILATAELFDAYDADLIKCLGERKDSASIARNLYTALREFDEEGITRIYSESFSVEGFGQAIMNRLLKAAGHKVIKLPQKGDILT